MIPYERIIQWVAGPFAVFIGGVAAKWVSSWGFLGQLGLGHNTVAKGITTAVVFVASSGVTYLAHHKWLDNAAKWWQTQVGTTIPGTDPALEGRVAALEQTQLVTGSGDVTDSAEWEGTRQRIADAMPAKDPFA